MSDYHVVVDGLPASPPPGWRLEWIDHEAGIALLTDGARSVLALVEGSDGGWVVTLHGRRIPVSVQTWRERLLAEAEGAGRSHVGPLEISSTLPGLVVAVAVAVGEQVAEGDALVTIEAMKMQNEVRAPRAGRVAELAVESGQAVAAGALLLRLE